MSADSTVVTILALDAFGLDAGRQDAVLTRQLMRERGLTASEAISIYKRASIRRRFPSQFLDMKLNEIEDAARQRDREARAALKLLFAKEYDK